MNGTFSYTNEKEKNVTRGLVCNICHFISPCSALLLLISTEILFPVFHRVETLLIGELDLYKRVALEAKSSEIYPILIKILNYEATLRNGLKKKSITAPSERKSLELFSGAKIIKQVTDFVQKVIDKSQVGTQIEWSHLNVYFPIMRMLLLNTE